METSDHSIDNNGENWCDEAPRTRQEIGDSEETPTEISQLPLVGMAISGSDNRNGSHNDHAGRNNFSTARRPRRTNTRWFGLAAVCLVMTAEYYSIDIPAALHQELKDYMHTDDANFELKFNLLYTVYAMPNVALPLLGGVLVDRWGPGRCMVFYSISLCLGQALFAMGLSQHSWALMLLGRAIFGLGGESICVAFSTLFSDWFDPSERAFAFGTQLAVSRLGSVMNNIVSPKVAHAFTTPWALWVGFLWNALGVVTACLAKYLNSVIQSQKRRVPSMQFSDNLSEPLLLQGGEYLELERSHHSDQLSNASEASAQQFIRDASREPQSSRRDAITNENEAIGLLDITRLGSSFWLICICCMVVYGCINPFNNVASGILMEKVYFQKPPSDCRLAQPQQCTAGSLAKEPNPSLDAHGASCPGYGFAPVLPTLPLNVSTDDFDAKFIKAQQKIACDNPFWAQNCTQDYCRALHEATEKAGRTMSIPYFVSALISPLIGSLVDRVGHRALLACGTSLTLMMVHLTLAYIPVDDMPVWIPLVGQGVGYALFSAVIWPSVGLVVEKKMTGTAYGIILSAQNCGVALFPILVAAIYRASQQKYIPNVELLFAACAAIGSVTGMLLWLVDRTNGNKLGQGTVNAS